jgi:oligopeptide transport system substrate-binding protein
MANILGFRAIWLGLCGAALIALSACGDGSNNKTAQSGTSNGGTAGEAVLRRGNAAEPTTLDPHFSTGTWEDNIISDLLVGLTTADAAGKAIPGAAESWDTSPDGKTWTFHLRDLQWSDGKPVTAGDFIYAWRRILDPKTAAPYAAILYGFKNAQAIASGKMKPEELGARAIDDKTVELQLENPAPYLPELLAHTTAYPVPQQVVEAKGRDWTKPDTYIGNGPYTLVEWIPNDHITLVKNPKFYDAASVKIDRVVYYPIADPDAGLKRFRAGELDTQDGIPTNQFDFVKSTMGPLLHSDPSAANGWLVINLQHKPFDDIRVREALNLAYDRETMAEKVVKIGQPPSYSIVPPGIANYPGGVEFSFKNTPYSERVKQAQQLMQQAGFGPNKHLQTSMATGPSPDAKRIAAAVQEIWRSIYVDTEIVQLDAQVYSSNLRTGNFDIAGYAWIADFNDPRNFLFLLLSDNELNFGHYKNPEFDALIKQSDQEQDLKKRGEILAKAEAIALKDVPWIPTRYQVTLNLVQPYVKGWVANVSDKNRSRWLSIDKQSREAATH